VVSELLRLVADDDPREIVRYPHIARALLDFTEAIVHQDLSRAWIWRQLGFLRSGDSERDLDHARSDLVDALTRHPEAIPAVVGDVTRRRGDVGALLVAISPRGWDSLARAVLRRGGRGEALIRAVVATGASDEPGSVAHQAPPSRPAERHGASSPLVPSGSVEPRPTPSDIAWQSTPTLRRIASRLATHERPSLAVLALAIHDPGRLFGGAESRLVRRLRAMVAEVAPKPGRPRAADAPAPVGHVRDATAPSLTSLPSDLGYPPEPDREPRPADHRQPTGATLDTPVSTAGPPPSFTTAPPSEPRPTSAAGAEPEPTPESPTDPSLLWAAPDADAPAGRTVAPSAAGRRIRGVSGYGGLLFLLRPMSIADAWSTLTELCERHGCDLKAAAHALAGVWIPELRPTDPARLAFCGLSPRAEAPALELGGPVLVEFRAALAELASRVVDTLDRLLPEAARREQQPGLLPSLVRRHAEILADPGWIELRFSLDTVRTDVRRAGLDCDPGFVPHLGVVIKFVYVER
jgi:hypothetical protein